ncbi:MAG TPA: hypothetical protein VGZ47_24075 [Gemmataceae bacterium]|nr:hypothetical protein [Gemmataceae bacterium]
MARNSTLDSLFEGIAMFGGASQVSLPSNLQGDTPWWLPDCFQPSLVPVQAAKAKPDDEGGEDLDEEDEKDGDDEDGDDEFDDDEDFDDEDFEDEDFDDEEEEEIGDEELDEDEEDEDEEEEEEGGGLDGP